MKPVNSDTYDMPNSVRFGELATELATEAEITATTAVQLWEWYMQTSNGPVKLRCYMRMVKPTYTIEWTGSCGKTYVHYSDENLVWSEKHPDHALLRLKVELSTC